MSRRLILLLFLLLPLSVAAKKTNAGPATAYPLGFYPGNRLPDKTVFLTFDDGPGDFTDATLDALSNAGVHATFFICGKDNLRLAMTNNHFRRYRLTLLRMIREGHTLGNHTLNHRDLSELTPAVIAAEFDSNQLLLEQEIGPEAPKMRFFRPPYGAPWILPHMEAQKQKVGKVIAARGYLALWNPYYDSTDSMEWAPGEWGWKGPRLNERTKGFRDKEKRIENRILSRADGRSFVVLMHDIHPTTVEVLPELISKLKERGYRFATFDDWLNWKTNQAATIPSDARK